MDFLDENLGENFCPNCETDEVNIPKKNIKNFIARKIAPKVDEYFDREFGPLICEECEKEIPVKTYKEK